MVNGKCTKGFPKTLRIETIVSKDGYSEFKRKDDGIINKKGTKLINKQRVVP